MMYELFRDLILGLRLWEFGLFQASGVVAKRRWGSGSGFGPSGFAVVNRSFGLSAGKAGEDRSRYRG